MQALGLLQHYMRWEVAGGLGGEEGGEVVGGVVGLEPGRLVDGAGKFGRVTLAKPIADKGRDGGEDPLSRLLRLATGDGTPDEAGTHRLHLMAAALVCHGATETVGR